MKKFLVVMSSVFFLIGCSERPETNKGPHSKARSAGFTKIVKEVKMIGGMIESNSFDKENLKKESANLAQYAHDVFNHFESDGSGKNGSAKENIWSDAKGFESKKEQFLVAVDKFNEEVQQNKFDHLKANFDVVGGSCKSCHQDYKLKD